MSSLRYEIRAGAYYDSVILMQLQKALAALPGVEDAGVVMATPANRELLTAGGFALSGVDAKADDLLIMIRGADEAAADEALAQVDELLQARRTRESGAYRPRSLAAAAGYLPQARWVLISVPGRYAAGVADEALDLGKHVFLYSDNVSLEDEIRLKQKAARARDCCSWGPTAARPSSTASGWALPTACAAAASGVVAASGTGLQAVTADIHNMEGGISQALGTGGRDLKEDVGGSSALLALDLLARDPQTEVIVLVSKPPAPAVAVRLLAAARHCGKPVVVNFIGYPPPARRLGNLFFTVNLAEAAERAVALLEGGGPEDAAIAPRAGYLRALFSGGTLAAEALLSLQATLAPLYSNIPLRPEQALADLWHSAGHTILDLGEDAFTQGRLHPMLDNDLRLRRLRQEAADPETGLILLDVVLGEGAHPDPAGELAPAIAARWPRAPRWTSSASSWGRTRIRRASRSRSGSCARRGRWSSAPWPRRRPTLRRGCSRRRRAPAPPLDLADFGGGLAAINVGLDTFYDSLLAPGGAGGAGGLAATGRWQ